MINWPEILVGSFIGGLVGAGVSWFFAWLSGKELAREAGRLRRLNNILIHGMENAGWIKVDRDDRGEVKGMVFELRPSSGQYKIAGQDARLTVGAVGTSTFSADIRIHDPEAPQSTQASPHR